MVQSPMSSFREPTRSRPVSPRSHVEFIDFDRANEIDSWRVEQFARTLDAPPKRPIGHVKFSVELANARVEPEQRVAREQQLIEADLRS